MIIDAHQHFWLMKERGGAWPPAESTAIYRSFEARDLEPLLDAAGVGGTIVVQSLDCENNTDSLLALAVSTPFILGIVGWVDLLDPSPPSRIDHSAANPKFKGVRAMLRDVEDTDWILHPGLAPAVESLIKHDLAFDALVTPRHFGPLLQLARQNSGLRIVIDHGGKPPVAQGHFVAWRRAKSDLAALPNVHCKLSGLVTEAGDELHVAAVRPYAETIVDLFGAQRTIWGSDWPVLTLVSNYTSWLSQCRDIVPDTGKAAVFGGNAHGFYRLASETRWRPKT